MNRMSVGNASGAIVDNSITWPWNDVHWQPATIYPTYPTTYHYNWPAPCSCAPSDKEQRAIGKGVEFHEELARLDAKERKRVLDYLRSRFPEEKKK